MDQLLVALDVDTAAEARALADALRGAVGGFKIGSRLFTSDGPAIVEELVARGDRVFLDLKFHDIPNTVAGAVARRHAARRLDGQRARVRRRGDDARGARRRRRGSGAAIVRAAARHRRDGADEPRASRRWPRSASPDRWSARSSGWRALAQAAGLDGVVASPQEIALIRRACGERFAIVTPGIRGAGDDRGRSEPDADRRRGASPPAPAISSSAGRSSPPPIRARPPSASPPSAAPHSRARDRPHHLLAPRLSPLRRDEGRRPPRRGSIPLVARRDRHLAATPSSKRSTVSRFRC